MAFFDAGRLDTLIARTATAHAAAQRLAEAFDDIIGPPPWAVQAAGAQPLSASLAAGTGTAAADLAGDNAEGSGMDDTQTDDGEPDDAVGTGDDADADDDVDVDVDAVDGQPDRTPQPPVSNQVVYAEELEPLRDDLRRYRFRLACSPIDLPADT